MPSGIIIGDADRGKIAEVLSAPIAELISNAGIKAAPEEVEKILTGKDTILTVPSVRFETKDGTVTVTTTTTTTTVTTTTTTSDIPREFGLNKLNVELRLPTVTERGVRRFVMPRVK